LGFHQDALGETLCLPSHIPSHLCARCQARPATVGLACPGTPFKPSTMWATMWATKLCRGCAGYLRSLLDGGRFASAEITCWIAGPAALLLACSSAPPSSGAFLCGQARTSPGLGRPSANKLLYAAYVEEQRAAGRPRGVEADAVEGKARRQCRPAAYGKWCKVRARWLASKLLGLAGRCVFCRRPVCRPRHHAPPEAPNADRARPAARSSVEASGHGRMAHLSQWDVCARHAWVLAAATHERAKPATATLRGTASTASADRDHTQRRAPLCSWCKSKRQIVGLVLGREGHGSWVGSSWLAKGCRACMSAAAWCASSPMHASDTPPASAACCFLGVPVSPCSCVPSCQAALTCHVCRLVKPH
jgi:hypothetical protein